jgi:hypothetical protein
LKWIHFLGTFAKLWKAAVSFVMSVCMSGRTDQLAFHQTGFHENLYLSIFHNSVEKIEVLLKSDKNNG